MSEYRVGRLRALWHRLRYGRNVCINDLSLAERHALGFPDVEITVIPRDPFQPTTTGQ